MKSDIDVTTAIALLRSKVNVFSVRRGRFSLFEMFILMNFKKETFVYVSNSRNVSVVLSYKVCFGNLYVLKVQVSKLPPRHPNCKCVVQPLGKFE